MAHFAEIDSAGTVLRIVIVDNSVCPDPAPENSESLGQQFLQDIGISGSFVQCSYNGTFRKTYPGPGYRYDADADVFLAPQPFPSWSLDANHDWQPPTPMPTEGGPYVWDEDTLSWTEISTE